MLLVLHNCEENDDFSCYYDLEVFDEAKHGLCKKETPSRAVTALARSCVHCLSLSLFLHTHLTACLQVHAMSLFLHTHLTACLQSLQLLFFHRSLLEERTPGHFFEPLDRMPRPLSSHWSSWSSPGSPFVQRVPGSRQRSRLFIPDPHPLYWRPFARRFIGGSRVRSQRYS